MVILCSSPCQPTRKEISTRSSPRDQNDADLYLNKPSLAVQLLKKKQTDKVVIKTNTNRDVLVIKISELALRELKQLRKVEVHLGCTEPNAGLSSNAERIVPDGSLESIVNSCSDVSENGLQSATLNDLRDALMSNIYKAVNKARADEPKRKLSTENVEIINCPKRLKPELSSSLGQHTLHNVERDETNRSSADIAQLNEVNCDDAEDVYKKAKPLPFLAFILSAVILSFLYLRFHKPPQEGLSTLPEKWWDPRGGFEDSYHSPVVPLDTAPPEEHTQTEPYSWKAARVAQNVLGIYQGDNPVAYDSQIFWRQNLQDPRIRLLLRWISQTSFRIWRRRAQERTNQDENARLEVLQDEEYETAGTSVPMGELLENALTDESQQALAVVENDRWFDLSYPVEVTSVVWNILIDFIFHWLTD